MPAKKPTKKNDAPEVAAVPAPETAKKPARKGAAASKAPAATHKSAAPRAGAARTATSPRVKKTAAEEKPAFDAALHQDEIAREAYFLWESRGHAHGHEGEDWFRATEIVRTRHQ